MALSYDTPSDSTNVFPLKLDMHRHPKVLYSSSNQSFGTYYKHTIESFGGYSEEVSQNTSVTHGKCLINLISIARCRKIIRNL